MPELASIENENAPRDVDELIAWCADAWSRRIRSCTSASRLLVCPVVPCILPRLPTLSPFVYSLPVPFIVHSYPHEVLWSILFQSRLFYPGYPPGVLSSVHFQSRLSYPGWPPEVRRSVHCQSCSSYPSGYRHRVLWSNHFRSRSSYRSCPS